MSVECTEISEIAFLKKENENLKLHMQLLQRFVDDRGEIEKQLKTLAEAALTSWENNHPDKECRISDCMNCSSAAEENLHCPYGLRELGIALSDIDELI